MDEKKFQCSDCDKSFKHKRNWRRHCITHKSKLYFCNICKKSFHRVDSLSKHQKKCEIMSELKNAKKEKEQTKSLQQYLESNDKDEGNKSTNNKSVPSGASKFVQKSSYNIMDAFESNYNDTYIESSDDELEMGWRDGDEDDDVMEWRDDVDDDISNMTGSGRNESMEETVVAPGFIPTFADEKLNKEILRNESVINVPSTSSSFLSHYNFRLPLQLESPHKTINDAFHKVLTLQKYKGVFKMNFSLGMILKNRETDQYRYFAPGSNIKYFSLAKLINRSSDMPRMTEDSYLKYIDRYRPNSKWIPLLATNIHIQVYPLDFPMG